MQFLENHKALLLIFLGAGLVLFGFIAHLKVGSAGEQMMASFYAIYWFGFICLFVGIAAAGIQWLKENGP